MIKKNARTVVWNKMRRKPGSVGIVDEKRCENYPRLVENVKFGVRKNVYHNRTDSQAHAPETRKCTTNTRTLALPSVFRARTRFGGARHTHKHTFTLYTCTNTYRVPVLVNSCFAGGGVGVGVWVGSVDGCDDNHTNNGNNDDNCDELRR